MGKLEDLAATAFTSPTPSPDSAAARSILDKNKGLNFVQRLTNPTQWPRLSNPDGSYSTHLMSWGSIGRQKDKKFIVYPSIVWDGKTQKLNNLGSEAQQHAIRTKEYIEFDNPQDADWFSQRYKAGVSSNPPSWKSDPGSWK